MDINHPEPSASPLLQYASPIARPRGWLLCIVGLFAWGTLVLVPIPYIVGRSTLAVWAHSEPLEPELEFVCAVATVLLAFGLPPVVTARYLLRGELKFVALTICVMTLPAAFGLAISIAIVCLSFGRYDWRSMGSGSVGAAFFLGALTVICKLVDIAAAHRQRLEALYLNRPGERAHAKS